MTSKNFNYHKAKQELDDILAWYESGEVDIEQAIAKYQKAEKILNDINAYLNDANAKIKKMIKQAK